MAAEHGDDRSKRMTIAAMLILVGRLNAAHAEMTNNMNNQ
jgi:hypothetical protein